MLHVMLQQTSRDATQLCFSCRRDHDAILHDEKVGGIAGRDKAILIQHQRLVVAGMVRLDAALDAYMLGVRIERRILRVRRRATHMHSKEPQSTLEELFIRFFIFRHNRDGRWADGP